MEGKNLDIKQFQAYIGYLDKIRKFMALPDDSFSLKEGRATN
jgi:hypothetical protein